MRLRSLVRLAAGVLAGLPALAGAQNLQLPDSAHSSVPPPYPSQGPTSLSQQDDARIAPGEPRQSAPGVVNGPRPPGAPTPLHEASPTTPSATNLTPMGTAPLIVDPATLRFRALPEAPGGVELATVKALPAGGFEGYLRIRAGGGLPAHWSDTPLDLTFVSGEASLDVDGGPLPAGPGTHAFLPAREAHAIDCSSGRACLVYVRSDGPMRMHYTNPAQAPAGAR